MKLIYKLSTFNEIISIISLYFSKNSANTSNNNGKYSGIKFIEFSNSNFIERLIKSIVDNKNIFIIICNINSNNIEDTRLIIEKLYKELNDKLQIKAENILFSSDSEIITRSSFLRMMYKGQMSSVICVTGTEGKTSTCYFLGQMIAIKNGKGGYIGTIGTKIFSFESGEIAEHELYDKDISKLTTPNPYMLCDILKKFKDNGVEVVALEASSHGIDQGRINHLDIISIGLTDITRDHLDYHKTEENYFNTKIKIFKDFLRDRQNADKNIILNSDSIKIDEIMDKLDQEDNSRYLFYGNCDECNIKLIDFISLKTAIIKLQMPQMGGYTFNFYHKLFPLFQIQNMMCALSLFIEYDRQVMTKQGSPNEMRYISIEKIIHNIIIMHQPAGRCEIIDMNEEKNTTICIDYAHKPSALEALLTSFRDYINSTQVSSNLIIVFGCGGERDIGKRAVMGQIAARLADVVILTDDNPRSENPIKIREDIISGITKFSGELYNIGDRVLAIHKGIDLLKPHDILIVAGKGPENTQLIGDQCINMNDKDIILKYLEELK